MQHQIRITVNGEEHRLTVPSHRTLLEFLREDLGLTGVKEGCGNGECGACTVLLDGVPVRSCLILALEAGNCKVETIEGLARGGLLHPLQEAFIEAGAVQCGFCTPGFIMAGKALLDRSPRPTPAQVYQAFGGHLCRCTGYETILRAMELAADKGA